MQLDQSMIGQRLTVRYRLARADTPSNAGAPSKTDVIGVLRQLDQTTAWLERRDGTIAPVPIASILIAKTVPQRPLRRRRAAHIEADTLQAISSRGWPAIESGPLGQWELRASDGFTARANSAAAFGDPGCPMPDALGHVAEFYRARSLSPLVQVIAGSVVESEILAAGWARRAADTVVMRVLDLAQHTIAGDVRIDVHASDAWLERFSRVSNTGTARAVLEARPRTGFLSIGEPVEAIARITVTGEWAGVSAVEVAPSSRGSGMAGRVVETGLARAGEMGADKAYTQVEASNTAAMRLFDRLGFIDHHEYCYLEPTS